MLQYCLLLITELSMKNFLSIFHHHSQKEYRTNSHSKNFVTNLNRKYSSLKSVNKLDS